MNSLYTLGVRQTNSIQSDLERLRNGDSSAALLGLHPPRFMSPTQGDNMVVFNGMDCR